MRIGVLALQGAFIEHIDILRRLGAEAKEIRKRADFKELDGLVLPGGESTAIAKLARELGLDGDIRGAIKEGMPVLGTCAGMIMLAKEVIGGDPGSFGVMDITARRNAYGRQLGSFSTVSGFGEAGDIPMTFIRAPIIESAAADVDILSRVDGKIVAARQKNMLAVAFHPELSQDTTVHSCFMSLVR